MARSSPSRVPVPQSQSALAIRTDRQVANAQSETRRIRNDIPGMFCILLRGCQLRALCLRSTERLIEIFADVRDVFDPDGDANVLRKNSRRQLFLSGQLLVGRGCGMNHQRLCVTEVGQVAGQFEVVNQLYASVPAALDSEPYN